MEAASNNIEKSLLKIKSQIRDLETRYERQAGCVRLLAVSKKKPANAIMEARKAGQLAFGENYVDEGVEKIHQLNDSSIEWHFIGAIQSRKTLLIAENFQWAHGVDRFKVVRRLSEQRPAQMPPLQICIQVNVDNEASKAGVTLDELTAFAAQCEDLRGITLRGLMAIPAPRDTLAEQREALAKMRTAHNDLKPHHPHMDTLSMGMSNDIEAAIAEGSTMVRVGTSIFGARDR